MLNFLKKLFAGKEPAVSEHAAFDNLPAWLDEKAKGIYSGLNSRISEHYSNIKQLLDRLKSASAELEKAEIKEPDKIEHRIKVTVLGNRDSYAKNMVLFANNLKIPETAYYKPALELCTLGQLALDSLSKNTHKSYYTAQHLFFDQVEAIAGIIKEIDSALKTLKKDVDSSNAEKIEELKEKIRQLLDQKESQDLLKEELKKQLSRRETLEKQKLEAEARIKEFDESREYKGFKQIMEDDDRLNEEIKTVKTEILNLFSPLETAFRKFARITTMHQKLVEQYAEDPLTAFLNDKQLNILVVLPNLKKNVETDTIDLKDKKKEKSLERIHEIDREKLNFINSKLEALKLKRRKFSEAIMSNDVLRKKKALLDDLNRVKKEQLQAETAISELEKKDTFSIEQLTEDIKKEIREVLNISLSITY